MNGAFGNLKDISSDVGFDLEQSDVYSRTMEAGRAGFQDTYRKVADWRAYLEGSPTNLSSFDDVGWVQRLKDVFEGKMEKDGRVREDWSGGPPKD